MIYVFGANGQLGQSLKKVRPQNLEVKFLSSSDVDITNSNELEPFFETIEKDDFIINCAAYTAVDKAESEKERAFEVNAKAAQEIGKLCKKYNSNLIHISTDYVFSGEIETSRSENDLTSPINIYGQSKLDGEKRIVESNCNYTIIRTSWVFSEFGNNFFKTMKNLSDREGLNVVNDQIGSPTYAPDLAEVIFKVIKNYSKCSKELYHFSNKDQCSWHEFSKEIMNKLGSNTLVNPIPTSEYPTPAKRPAYSLLKTTKIELDLSLEIRSWKEALEACIKEC